MLQYYCNLAVTSVVNRITSNSDAALIIKLVSGSVEERNFRDLRSEIYLTSEEKTSAISDGKNGQLITLT